MCGELQKNKKKSIIEPAQKIPKMEQAKSETCQNCGCGYALKKGMPELCWICGLPTGEKINEL